MSEVADFSVGEPEPIRNIGEPSSHDLVCEDLVNAFSADNKTAGLVIADIQERKEFGLRKYGTLLQASNGRNHIKDGYAELLDCLVYAKLALEVGNVNGPQLMYKELIEVTFRWRAIIFLMDLQDAQIEHDKTVQTAVRQRSRELRK